MIEQTYLYGSVFLNRLTRLYHDYSPKICNNELVIEYDLTLLTPLCLFGFIDFSFFLFIMPCDVSKPCYLACLVWLGLDVLLGSQLVPKYGFGIVK
jgi:hypothetical protein